MLAAHLVGSSRPDDSCVASLAVVAGRHIVASHSGGIILACRRAAISSRQNRKAPRDESSSAWLRHSAQQAAGLFTPCQPICQPTNATQATPPMPPTLIGGAVLHRRFHHPLKAGSGAVHQAASCAVEAVLCSSTGAGGTRLAASPAPKSVAVVWRQETAPGSSTGEHGRCGSCQQQVQQADGQVPRYMGREAVAGRPCLCLA